MDKPLILSQQKPPSDTVTFSATNGGRLALLVITDGEHSRVVGAVSAEFAGVIVGGFNDQRLTGEIYP